MTDITFLAARPGPQNDQYKADIIAHLRDDRTVMASMNMGTQDFRAALAELIRDNFVAVDRDHACSLTKKGENYGL